MQPHSAVEGRRALTVAMIVSLATAVAAFGLGLAAQSMLVLAFAGDKLADAAMSALNRWGHRYARTAADDDHPWGHGKAEGALSLAQGALLAGIAVSVAAGAVGRLIRGATEPDVGLALVALVGTFLVSGALAVYLGRAARTDDSLVLRADAAHYRIDLLTSSGALVGIALVWLTGLGWLDPAAALVFVVLMAREAWGIFRAGLAEVLDESLPDADVAKVEAVLATYADRIAGWHGLRTRRAGPLPFVEVHADLDPVLPLADAHRLVQAIAADVRAALPGARVLVHPDALGLSDLVDAPLRRDAAATPTPAP